MDTDGHGLVQKHPGAKLDLCGVGENGGFGIVCGGAAGAFVDWGDEQDHSVDGGGRA